MQEFVYILSGDPTPLARVRFGQHGRVYDQQKQVKLIMGITIAQQHNDRPFLRGPLSLEITFFMPMPVDKKLRRQRVNKPHIIKPDLDNMIKFVIDVCNTITYKDDCIISHINARKIWSENPRTEFILRPDKIGKIE
jgi:Holliday junction resolvase RusA-like endonuclease